VNRLKLAKVSAWLDDQDGKSSGWCPRQFAAGRHGPGLLTVEQKKDILRHTLAMAASNRALFPREIKESMYKFYLHNCGIVDVTKQSHDELPWKDFEQCLPSLDNVYRDWRSWVRDNYSDDFTLLNSKTYWKSNVEAASITPRAINQHFDELQKLLLELKLMDPETECLTEEAGHCIWCMDEKGLSGDGGAHVKNQRAVSTRTIGATRSHGDSSFCHVSLAPFVNLLGDVAPPFVFVSGSAKQKAWADIWPKATVIATEKGSITTTWFVQILGLFGRHCRETLKISPAQSIILLLDSGGGSQLHISADASLIAEVWGLRLFLFGRYMTPAICPLDQHPNKEAEKRFHSIRSTGYNLSGLGALHAAREETQFSAWHLLFFKANCCYFFLNLDETYFFYVPCGNSLAQTQGLGTRLPESFHRSGIRSSWLETHEHPEPKQAAYRKSSAVAQIICEEGRSCFGNRRGQGNPDWALLNACHGSKLPRMRENDTNTLTTLWTLWKAKRMLLHRSCRSEQRR
jgi:hypothetical protein